MVPNKHPSTKKPAMVVNYNKYVVGFDEFDQLRTLFASGHPSKKCWKVLFFNLLDMAITNAHICYKVKYNVSLFDFRVKLVRELFSATDICKNRSAVDEPSTSGPPIS